MFDLKAYSSQIQTILGPHEGGQRLMPLAPREPQQGAGLNLLTQASAEHLFEAGSIASKEFAHCVRSALFLYFSALQESHTISQGIHSSTGSFLHGIMHRQEPDFGNSKYWFRRVAAHDVYPLLRQSALDLFGASNSSTSRRLHSEIDSRSKWEPQWFVDECEAAHEGKDIDLEQSLAEIQRVEWQHLFDYCYRKAVRKS